VQYRTLGRTNLQVSLLSLGSGGANRLGQVNQTDRPAMHRFVRHALDLGINLFDTAPVYDESEVVLGEALSGVPRDSFVLSTKFGARGEQTPGALRRSLERSLTRLRTDFVDVLFLHGMQLSTYDLNMRFVDELRQAQQDGLTRWLGVTEVYEWDPGHRALLRALDEGVFDVIMVGHNLVTPGGLLDLLPKARARNIGVMVMCAVRTVITTPELLREAIREWKADGALPEDAVPDDAPLDWVLGPGVETLADAAYKFAADSPAVATVLTGTANTAHLEANVRAILGPPLAQDISRRLQETFGPANRSVILPSMRRPPAA
jgi:aryl-alcohol dehydrogenase-like predicted oxidoreductase